MEVTIIPNIILLYKSDNINRMITLSGEYYLVTFSKWAVSNVITLSN